MAITKGLRIKAKEKSKIRINLRSGTSVYGDIHQSSLVVSAPILLTYNSVKIMVETRRRDRIVERRNAYDIVSFYDERSESK